MLSFFSEACVRASLCAAPPNSIVWLANEEGTPTAVATTAAETLMRPKKLRLLSDEAEPGVAVGFRINSGSAVLALAVFIGKSFFLWFLLIILRLLCLLLNGS